jgi:hypothetical protein
MSRRVGIRRSTRQTHGQLKAARLPRPWPLLREGQDPDSLEARVAFHLHRLKLVGQPLHRAGFHKTDAADLSAARVPLSQGDIARLARAMGVETKDLRRALTTHEKREWAFYRSSAADAPEVWRKAREAWIQKQLTDRQAANIMRMSPSAVSPLRAAVLAFPAALRLTTALKLPGGPEALLPWPVRDNAQRSR